MAEVTDTSEFENKILGVMSNYQKGVSQKILQDSIPSLNVKQLASSLNKLLNQHKIEVLQKGNQLVYKLSSTQKYQGTDLDEKVIFKAVEKAGNDGIMPRDIKQHCNLPQPQINKILKALETKKMIKCVTSTSKKKLYLLYDLDPSPKITGGIFYSGQEFEAEYVKVLGDQCYRYLVQAKGLAEKLSDPISQRNASLKSSKDICDYINGLKISKIIIGLKDIENILDSLIYDDKIEKSISLSEKFSTKGNVTENFYRVSNPLIENGGLMMVPCGVCRVYQDCRVGGIISPSTCEYIQQWLEF